MVQWFCKLLGSLPALVKWQIAYRWYIPGKWYHCDEGRNHRDVNRFTLYKPTRYQLGVPTIEGDLDTGTGEPGLWKAHMDGRIQLSWGNKVALLYRKAPIEFEGYYVEGPPGPDVTVRLRKNERL